MNYNYTKFFILYKILFPAPSLFLLFLFQRSLFILIIILYQFLIRFHYYLDYRIGMQAFALIMILYFFIGACVCLLICVNPNDPGVIGRLRKFVFSYLPDIFSSFVKKVFGERVLGYLGNVKVYLLETNHPIVQIFYLLIAVGGFIGYSITGIFKHMPNQYVSEYGVIFAYGMAMICFWVYYKACAVSPGQVTKKNVSKYIEQFQSYFDDLIYKKSNECKTCKIDKPARSKHCSICKMCVSKFDHHCIWIRQCVGQKNYKYFIAFLSLHSIWCCYLAYIGAFSLYAALKKMNFWQLSFRTQTGVVRGNNLLAFQYVFVMETFFFFIIVMCAIMGITLAIFVSYHFYLISQQQTTNERVKKNDYIDFLKKQLKHIKNFEKQNPELKNQFQYRNEKMTRKQFQEHKEDVNRKLSILEKKMHNPGFWRNLKTIFSEPDN